MGPELTGARIGFGGPDAAAILSAWRDRTLMESQSTPIWHGDPKVFVDTTAQHQPPDSISKQFQAGLPGRLETPNPGCTTCANTAATLWLRQGVGLRTIPTLLGAILPWPSRAMVAPT